MPRAWLKGGGETGDLMRSLDWGSSPLGPPTSWAQSLRSVVGLLLGSKFPMFVAWGPELGFLYNDAYAEILGAKHPAAMGQRFQDIWPEIWDDISPLVDTALAGEATYREDLPLVMNRRGFDEQTWFTFSYSPVRDEVGAVAGMFCACVETTARVRTDQAQAFLAAFDDQLRDVVAADRILSESAALIARHLAADRVHWAHVDLADDRFDVQYEWTSERAPSLIGSHRLSDFGEALIADMTRGETIAVTDALADSPASPEAVEAEFGDAVRGVLSVPLIRSGVWEAALCVHTLAPRAWRNDERDFIRDVAERAWTRAQRAEAEARVRESAEQLHLATEAAEVGLWDLDPTADVLFWPPRVKEMFGISPDSPISMADFYAGLHPDDLEEVSAAFAAAVDPARRALYDVEYRTVGKEDGRVRWVAAKGRGIFDEGGQCVRVIGTAIDITVRKSAEEHLRLMVNELNHRVKNSLATVQAIAAQTLRRGEIPEAVREALVSRLIALAEAHDVLTDQKWSGADLREIAQQAAAPYASLRGHSPFVLDGPPVYLPPKTAIALALAFHELATNAGKYGALSTPEGRVEVSWRTAPSADGRRLHLTWREVGGPPVRKPERSGFGARLIQRGLGAELDGEVRLEFLPDGVVCTIDAALPVERPGSPQAELQLA